MKPDNDTYENEVRVLSMLQRLAHPNILKLVACYTHNGNHNLISPYIDGGTLRGVLEHDDASNLSHAEILYLMAGLVSAIWALHEFVVDDTEPSHKGLHQDLHPDNILFDGERLILADFGLSSIKLMQQSSHTHFKGGKGYWQAPECADLTAPYEEHRATRASDIFALGCIIAELLVYLLNGPSGVKSFRDARRFSLAPIHYSLYHKGTAPNEAVEAFLSNLTNDDERASIKGLVQLVSQMLEIVPSKRPSARQVAANLFSSTIQAYAETFTRLYEPFRHFPDSIVEEARFQSWLQSLDTSFWRNSIGPTNMTTMFDSIVDTLRQINGALEVLKPDMPDIDCRSFLEVRQLNTKLLNMLPSARHSTSRSILSSIILAKLGTDKQNALYRHLRSAGDSRIVQMADTKQIVSEIEDGSAKQLEPSYPVLSNSLVYTNERVGPYQLAKIPIAQPKQKKVVLVEKIECHDDLRWQRILTRVHALAELLSRQSLQHQLRTPPFYGLHLSQDAFSFELLYDIGQKQKVAVDQSKPRCLRELLEDQKVETCPALEVRFKLAATLAESLGAFHDVDWFHKDLTSLSILFFPSDAVLEYGIGDPYLIGFQHSRSTDDFSEGPLQDKKHHRYHHPAYISTENHQFKRFRRQYDYYSFGILLLEIGFWETIDTIASEHRGEDNSKFSESLINIKLPLLGSRMGSRYASLVADCLRGWNEGDERSSSIALKAQANIDFKHKVVKPLRSLSEQFDTSIRAQGSPSTKRLRSDDDDVSLLAMKRTKLR